MLKVLRVGLVALCAAGLAGCSKPQVGREAAEAPREKPIGSTLRLTVVPYEAADKLSEEYAPMAAYLAKRMGAAEGKFMPVIDYAGVLAALQAGQVDVAYLSAFPYALASGRIRLKPLAMPWAMGSLDYRGIIFTRADSGIKSLADLKGKEIAFGDLSSTTGYLLPKAMLEKQGILAHLKGARNAGNANMVVAAVENGTAAAGCAYESVFQVAYRETPEKAKLMRVLAETEAIPNGIYVARGDLPDAEVAKLRKAFMDMNTDPEGRAAMLKAPNDKIVPADDKLFDKVRSVARSQNVTIESFGKPKRP